jgi:transposase
MPTWLQIVRNAVEHATMATKRRPGSTTSVRTILKGSGAQVLEIHRLGPHPLIQFFLEQLGVTRILDKHIHSSRDGKLTHGEAIGVLVHNVLVSRDPLYRLSEWIEPIDPGALGLSEEQKLAINDDRIARALDQLAEYGGRGVFFQLALRSIKLFGLKTDRIHFDTTTITFFGEYRGSVREPRIVRGHNKDHRPDLKQIVFGVNVTSDGAVPLSHGVFSGNKTDDSLHRDNFDSLRDLLAKDDFIYVADCKLCTKENLAYLESFGGKFVTILPRSRKEDVDFREKLHRQAARWRVILTVERTDRAYRIDTYATTSMGPAQSQDGFRLIWIRSSAKAEDDRQSREARIEKAKAALKDLSEGLNKRQLKTRKQIRSAAKKILRECHCEEFLRVDLKSNYLSTPRRLRPGRPKAGDAYKRVGTTLYEIKVSENAIRIRQEANTDGVFPLITNLPSQKKAVEVLQIYRYQPYLERRFENLKTEYAVTPAYLKSPQRIVGLVHVYFLALMVAALIEREIRRAMERQRIEVLPIYPEERECRAPTTPRLLDFFSQVEWFRHIGKEGSTVFPVRLSAMQAQILNLLGVPQKAYEGQN